MSKLCAAQFLRYWHLNVLPLATLTFDLQGQKSKGTLPLSMVCHIPKMKGIGQELRPVERAKGQINNDNDYNDDNDDNNAIIGVQASCCLQGQHEE